jgi:hypothetical protein
MNGLVASLSVVGCLLAACSGSGAGRAAAGAMIVDARGASLRVAHGELAGVAVTIPPGALAEPTRVTISPSRAPAHPGFRVVGPAAIVEPTEAPLALPVTLTLPYDGNVPATTDVVVLARDAAGAVVELGPVAVDQEALRVTVDTRPFATFWAAQRLFGGVALPDYLPLTDGNRWDFDNGLRITVLLTPDEPNLGGLPVYRLQFDSPPDNRGFYVLRDPFGVNHTELLGEFSTVAGGYQQIHSASSFLPARITVGQEVRIAHTFVGFEPYGASEPAHLGQATVRVLADVPRDVDTPAGTFADVVRIRVQAAFTDDGGGQDQASYVLTLAREVGPVVVEGFGPRAALKRGFVGGKAIGG